MTTAQSPLLVCQLAAAGVCAKQTASTRSALRAADVSQALRTCRRLLEQHVASSSTIKQLRVCICSNVMKGEGIAAHVQLLSSTTRDSRLSAAACRAIGAVVRAQSCEPGHGGSDAPAEYGACAC